MLGAQDAPPITAGRIKVEKMLDSLSTYGPSWDGGAHGSALEAPALPGQLKPNIVTPQRTWAKITEVPTVTPPVAVQPTSPVDRVATVTQAVTQAVTPALLAVSSSRQTNAGVYSSVNQMLHYWEGMSSWDSAPPRGSPSESVQFSPLVKMNIGENSVASTVGGTIRWDNVHVQAFEQLPLEQKTVRIAWGQDGILLQGSRVTTPLRTDNSLNASYNFPQGDRLYAGVKESEYGGRHSSDYTVGAGIRLDENIGLKADYIRQEFSDRSTQRLTLGAIADYPKDELHVAADCSSDFDDKHRCNISAVTTAPEITNLLLVPVAVAIDALTN